MSASIHIPDAVAIGIIRLNYVKHNIYIQKKCFPRTRASQIKWSDYLSCEHNLANNRQVRMLANYNKLGCNGLRCRTKSENCTGQERNSYDKMLLESAKETLLSLSFFGLSELQNQTKYLFEKTFNNKIKLNTEFKTVISSRNQFLKVLLNDADVINMNNYLDFELYKYAKELFTSRIKYFQTQDANNSSTNSLL